MSDLNRFKSLIQPCSTEAMEAMAAESRRLTLKHFGSTIRLFAPLYLSNECVNICKYCGFSRDNPILRSTLTPDQVEQEVRHLLQEGFRNILLVAGEHPKFISKDYLAECTRRLQHLGVPSINLEVGPLETEDYIPLVQAGAEGLVVYQETYNREVYAEMHTAGPKRDFDWRRACPERAYAAGFRRIGIGALLGLADWREEAIALAIHLDQLLRTCWKSFFTISLPRLRPAAGEFKPISPISDREYVQLLCAFRMVFPQVGLVLSTRESPELRNGLIPLGITMMSAGSHTEPGGYTGTGRDSLHITRKGRQEKPAPDLIASEGEYATEQFSIADTRSAAEVAEQIRRSGYEPVWKDWDSSLSADSQAELTRTP